MIWLLIVSIGLICGFLGVWAGAEGTSKSWRRVGIPIILALGALLVLKNLWCLTIGSMSGFFSMGYGIPSSTDEGSVLGKFWYKIFSSNELLSNIFTRGTIGLLVGLSLVSIPVMKGSWLLYVLVVLGAMFNYILWGALVKKEGTFVLFDKILLWEEVYIYLGVGVLSSVLVFF